VGDVVAGPMLAHKAMEEGVMVAELMAGQAGHCNFDTDSLGHLHQPEIAWVGKTEQQLKAEGIAYKAGKIPVRRQRPRARHGRPERLRQDARLCDETDRILGVHIIGANASELISEGVVAMEFGAASEDLARICHAHPTLSEVVHEAALACDKRPAALLGTGRPMNLLRERISGHPTTVGARFIGRSVLLTIHKESPER
jgi:dihydrolipoamide dehydrogenase